MKFGNKSKIESMEINPVELKYHCANVQIKN